MRTIQIEVSFAIGEYILLADTMLTRVLEVFMHWLFIGKMEQTE
ncbi:hypothetical protein [Paenibacillus campi]|nr:hypothetical protein [Paenibacillus sp. SGZ-1009]